VGSSHGHSHDHCPPKDPSKEPAISPFAEGEIRSSKQPKLLSFFFESHAFYAFVQGPSNQEGEGPHHLPRYSGSGRPPTSMIGAVHICIVGLHKVMQRPVERWTVEAQTLQK